MNINKLFNTAGIINYMQSLIETISNHMMSFSHSVKYTFLISQLHDFMYVK